MLVMSLCACRSLLLIVLLSLVQISQATPLLLYHSLEELSESAYNALPSSGRFHKNWRASIFKPTNQTNLWPRRDGADYCKQKGQMFSTLAQQQPSKILAPILVLTLVNIPITIVLIQLLRRLTPKVKAETRSFTHGGQTPEDESRLASVGRNAFAEKELRKLRKSRYDEK